jgi:hypothetical protein
MGLFLYFQLGWTNHYSKNQVDDLISSINKSQTLPDSFYIVYDKMHNDRHERITKRYFKSFWPEFFKIKQPKRYNWQLVAARTERFKGYRYQIAPITLAFKINRHTTPEKCFDYSMAKFYSDYSKTLNQKDNVINLNSSDKIIHFLIAMQRPFYNNSHPAAYKQKADSLRKIIFTD